MGRSRPLLRAALYPHLDFWAGGPGSNIAVIRFGLWTGWRLAPEAVTPTGVDVALQLALLTPEVPFSILPHALRQRTPILQEPLAQDTWQGRPIPRWRGVSCRAGISRIRLSSQGEEGGIELPILVLLPEQDPPGPRPEVAYLGMEFLIHYGIDVALQYSALRYIDPNITPPSFPVDRSIPAGYLEMD